jgi:hypothetical protein
MTELLESTTTPGRCRGRQNRSERSPKINENEPGAAANWTLTVKDAAEFAGRERDLLRFVR